MPIIGPYPVPLLGFGLSPMVGYFAVLGIVLRNRKEQAATGAFAAAKLNQAA
jgi:cell division protein FtsW (lipid II flippase)